MVNKAKLTPARACSEAFPEPRLFRECVARDIRAGGVWVCLAWCDLYLGWFPALLVLSSCRFNAVAVPVDMIQATDTNGAQWVLMDDALLLADRYRNFQPVIGDRV